MVRAGSSGPFREVRGFPEICGSAAEERTDILVQVAEGVPPTVEPQAPAAVEEAQLSRGAALEHPTAKRAQRRGSVRSRTQQRNAANDSAGLDLLSSQLREEKARNSALQAELDELRRAHAEEKVQLQAELMQLERARDAHAQQSRNSAVRQPCVAIFYEELPGQPSRVVPIEKARELVESARLTHLQEGLIVVVLVAGVVSLPLQHQQLGDLCRNNGACRLRTPTMRLDQQSSSFQSRAVTDVAHTTVGT